MDEKKKAKERENRIESGQKGRYLLSSLFLAKRSSLRGIGPTLSPSCRFYEPEAGLYALRAGRGPGWEVRSQKAEIRK